MMKLLVLTIAAVLFTSGRASVVQGLPISSRILSTSTKNRLRSRIDAAGGCNLNICFAIDGSGSINSTEFRNEKDFVLDVVSVIVDNEVDVGAVQYAASVRTITDLTQDDARFNQLIENEQQLGGASFVVGGVNACFSQLFRRRGEPLKMVILGDGRSNIGSSAARRADLFRSIGGDVCVVAAGFVTSDDPILIDIAGGDKSKVFEVDSFIDVLTLEQIAEQLVIDICNLN